jgi:hypothetical protein
MKPDPRRHRPPSPLGEAAAKSPGAEAGRGYFLSSIDLQSGLEVSEEELQALPPEFAEIFAERHPG